MVIRYCEGQKKPGVIFSLSALFESGDSGACGQGVDGKKEKTWSPSASLPARECFGFFWFQSKQKLNKKDTQKCLAEEPKTCMASKPNTKQSVSHLGSRLLSATSHLLTSFMFEILEKTEFSTNIISVGIFLQLFSLETLMANDSEQEPFFPNFNLFSYSCRQIMLIIFYPDSCNKNMQPKGIKCIIL